MTVLTPYRGEVDDVMITILFFHLRSSNIREMILISQTYIHIYVYIYIL